MTELLFTTNDVAKMLQVDKSTVKRWTDDGKLKCFRTPGGHRKFRAEDLYQFMADYSYGISPPDFYPQFASDESVIRRIIAEKQFNVLASVCFSAAIKGKRDEVVNLFSETYKNGLGLPQIFDEILRPTIKKISDLHISGKVLASEKQLAYNALSNGVVLFSDMIHKPASNDRKAICAMVENDLDDIELKALAVLLESRGFEVLNLGTSAGTESVAQLVKSRQPHFVFLVASNVANKNILAVEHRKIQFELRVFGGKLIVGGAGYTKELLESTLSGLYDKFCANFKEFAMIQHEKNNPGNESMSNDQ
jgi:MerR family transcriptional regulator, light-induced transcriptional regulator